MLFEVGVASKISLLGQAGHTTPSAALFGSPLRANAPMLFIIDDLEGEREGWKGESGV